MTARPLLALAVGLALAVAVDPAGAATVRLVEVGGETAVSFTAAAGERNSVSMNRGGPRWLVQDLTGNALTTVPPCAPTPVGLGTAATCPADRVDFATAELGDGND
jgi:hypothetical protein